MSTLRYHLYLAKSLTGFFDVVEDNYLTETRIRVARYLGLSMNPAEEVMEEVMALGRAADARMKSNNNGTT